MDGNHDEEKETRNEIVFAYILIGLSPLILLIPVTNIVLLLWLVGLVFTAILIYRRHALPELQRNLMYLAVVIFILGLVFVEGSLISMISQDISSLVGHVQNGKIQVKYLVGVPDEIIPFAIVGNGILYGLCYALLGVGLVKGRSRPLFIVAMAAYVIMTKISQIISFNNYIASLGPGDSFISVSSLPSKIPSVTNTNNIYTPAVIALSAIGTLILTASFIMIVILIYREKIRLVYKKTEEDVIPVSE